MLKKTFVLTALCVVAFGCATKREQINPRGVYVGKKDLMEGEIKLPANSSTENFRKLLMMVNFKAKTLGKSAKLEPAMSEALSLRMQTEMAKLKRFSIFSVHGRSASGLANQLADIGEANVVEYDAASNPPLDLYLSGNITLSKQRIDKFKFDELVYEVEIDITCEVATTKQVKFAEKAKGRAVRKQYTSIANGKLISGYSQADEAQAIIEAGMKALAGVANKLGNTYPVGGKLIGFSRSGTRFTFDKGFEQGIGKDSQVVLYVNDGGVDIPLAIAEASPTAKPKSSAKIYRWNDDDPDAKAIIADIKAGKWMNYKLYAVQYGMPVPPEWENLYKGN